VLKHTNTKPAYAACLGEENTMRKAYLAAIAAGALAQSGCATGGGYGGDPRMIAARHADVIARAAARFATWPRRR
jgi:hypothetical protein